MHNFLITMAGSLESDFKSRWSMSSVSKLAGIIALACMFIPGAHAVAVVCVVISAVACVASIVIDHYKLKKKQS